MKTPTRYQVEQLTLNFDDLDHPQFSICPKCSSDIISLADGCRLCGWSENQSKIDECSSKNIPASKNCSSKTTPPSKNNPRKSRRKKGEGNGSLRYRMVTKNGRQYTDAYYHYIENGKKRTKYIPKKLLNRVKEAESRKLPVADILVLLGGDEKNPRKSFSTKDKAIAEQTASENTEAADEVLETSVENPRKITPPSKKRKQGEGTGYIECKPIKRSGKEYKQYWYHYEEWSEGDRVVKKSRYIPKRLLAWVEKMNEEKAAVREILVVLGVKD